MLNLLKSSHRDSSAVAMIEGLLICLPIWIFLALISYVLSYWEVNHLDHVMQYGSAMANRVIATDQSHLDTGNSGNKYNPPKSKVPQFYLNRVSSYDKPPVYYYYITDYVSANRIRKFAGVRRFNTWMSHPFLKGQNPTDEGKKIQKWYDDMGNKVLNDNRKHLQLGS